MAGSALCGRLQHRFHRLRRAADEDLVTDDDGGSLQEGVFLQDVLAEILLGELQDHGCTMSAQRIDELLSLDIGLNVDGLIAWLARVPITR